MTVPGPHACRAAADDLNTALGGDLKLTAFGPRLPELSREAEVLLFDRRVLGEFVHTVTISWSASPSGDDAARSIFWHHACATAPRCADCEILWDSSQRLSKVTAFCFASLSNFLSRDPIRQILCVIGQGLSACPGIRQRTVRNPLHLLPLERLALLRRGRGLVLPPAA